MDKKKVFILLPDGVGLRNFAYTDFCQIGALKGFDITFWNNTAMDLSAQGFKEIRINKAANHPFTDVLKNARKRIEIRQNIKHSNDLVYQSYLFPLSFKNLKSSLKSIAQIAIEKLYGSEKGLRTLREKIVRLERQTPYYKYCREVLEIEKPYFLFCTNQRISLAIAPVVASNDLNIPTGTFIFSWDNLPKATMVLETDHYFVWSQFMKNELLGYYPYISKEAVHITGTPQFEPHFDQRMIASRSTFLDQHSLPENLRYICYSGDDITTSPHDPQYLSDVSDAVRSLNEKGRNLAIIFRRCPVDFSDRYDEVLAKHKDIIFPIDPDWIKSGSGWNSVFPTKSDLVLQANTVRHCELVINLGSSMVFDFAVHDKPCGFINYEVTGNAPAGWSIKKIYNYLHFRSMPSSKAVFWLDDPRQIAEKIENMLNSGAETVDVAKDWFRTINLHPPQHASERIWDAISRIVSDGKA